MIKGFTKTLVNVSLGSEVAKITANTQGLPDFAKTGTNLGVGLGVMGSAYKDLKIKKIKW